jgi:hypothetical protein
MSDWERQLSLGLQDLVDASAEYERLCGESVPATVPDIYNHGIGSDPRLAKVKAALRRIDMAERERDAILPTVSDLFSH